MPTEPIQPGKASDGNGLVLFVPTLADPSKPKVSELTGATVKKLTYGLTPDGFTASATENTVTTGRYTLEQAIELSGTVTDTLSIKYVYTGESTDVVRTTLPFGTTGFIVQRLGYANDAAIAASQLVSVYPISAGRQLPDAPTANSELTITQKLNITGKVERLVPVVAT